MREIAGDDYQVRVEDQRVHFSGVLRLPGPAYGPISDLLQDVAQSAAGEVQVDLRALLFVNSAGINVLYRFAIALRKKGGTRLVVLGAESIGWQQRSLRNLSHFHSDLDLQFS